MKNQAHWTQTRVGFITILFLRPTSQATVHIVIHSELGLSEQVINTQIVILARIFKGTSEI